MALTDAFSIEITEERVYAAIADVLGPELDETLVKLGFIDSVRVDGRDVTVAFKLPTYWCSPNFAYLMAVDLRTKVLTIPGVRKAEVLLLEHCTDDEINSGINGGKPFTEAFPNEAEDNLEDLRLIFLRKGFLVRQDTLLRRLQKTGIAEDTLLHLRIVDMEIDEDADCARFITPERIITLERAAHTAQGYLKRAATLSIAHQPHNLLFTDEHGQAIPVGGLQTYVRIDLNEHFVTVAGRDIVLTRTEYAVPVELANNVGHVLTTNLLVQRAWGDQYSDATGYVKGVIRRLRVKLEQDPAHPRYIITEPYLGYRLKDVSA